jgi:hypothetical protein
MGTIQKKCNMLWDEIIEINRCILSRMKHECTVEIDVYHIQCEVLGSVGCSNGNKRQGKRCRRMGTVHERDHNAMEPC